MPLLWFLPWYDNNIEAYFFNQPLFRQMRQW